MRTLVSLLLLTTVLHAQAPSKRPLSHADYDLWASVTGMTLSPDGRFVAYTVSAPKGDASFRVKNLATGIEWTYAKGGTGPTPAMPPTTDDQDDDQIGPPNLPRPSGISGSPTFTPDSKKLYFVLTPTKAETDKATADKKKPDEMPKTALCVLDLATGTITERITGIRSFSVTGKDAGLLILVKEPKPEPKAEEKPKVEEKPEAKPEKKPEPKREVAPMPKPQDFLTPLPGFAGRGRGRVEASTGETLPDMGEGMTLPQPLPADPGRGVGIAFGDQEPKKDEPAAAPSRTGSEIVIRNLADGKEVTYSDVQEYMLTKDYSQIVYSVAAKKNETNGVRIATTLQPETTFSLITGPGRYYRLTWDETQTQLAFFLDDSLPPATPTAPATVTPPTTTPGGRFGKGPRTTTPPVTGTTPATTPAPSIAKPKVLLWTKPEKGQPSQPATLVIGPDILGLKKGYAISDRGGLSFSADGLKLRVSIMPEPEKPAEPKKPAAPGATTPTTDKIDLDIWHWKDDVLQPMQKIRASGQRNRSYAAVYLLDSKKFIPLADEDRSLRAPDYGDWTLGSSDVKYRHATWDSPTPSDYTLVNVRTGESKPAITAGRSTPFVSPHGKYLAAWDGKQWFTMSIPDGRKTVLTTKLKTKFINDDFDMPMQAPSYGLVGWSPDDQHVYVSDKHDIWKLAADGSDAVNVTQIGAISGIRFRLIRVEKPEEDDTAERDRGLDAKLPWLLSAEHLTTHDTGYYRLTPGEKPKLLLMGARNYAAPVKAKKADVMLMTISTFSDYPDYYASTSEFKEVKRVTDANPHRKDYNWATAELVNYTNTDGVKLQAMLVKPENFDPKKQYPMVVYIYEKLSNGLHQYRAPSVTRGQVINPIWYASNGYLVLMPDIAYKTGHPGQSALQCVLPAIQTVVDRGYVNEKAIGINGQSWGGYQIAYMVTQTNRFKAAVAGAAVTNMTSAYNGIRWGSGMARQFQYEHTQSRIGATLWQAPMLYLENSPVFAADRVATPLLMINNDNDDAVPWYQGIEFYLSLRRLNKEVYMLNYNGEPHNLAKSANARDFAVRMHQFFEHHLKGAPMPEWMAKGVPYHDRDKEKEQWKKLLSPAEK